MGRYCTVDQVKNRFRKITDVLSYQTAVESNYIPYAENFLDGRLGVTFTVPFSSNNLTAQDLSIDLTYAKIIMYDDPKKYASIMKHVNMVIDDLIAGVSVMLTEDGTEITPINNPNEAWSSTMSYSSAFGHGAFETFITSSGQLYDEEQAQ